MTFESFRDKYLNAENALANFTGARDFPGLGVYDRLYKLTDDCMGWPCSVIVRVTRLNPEAPHIVPLTVLSHRGHSEDLEFDDMTAEQLHTIARIKVEVTEWIKGIRAHLPPSTDKRWRRDHER